MLNRILLTFIIMFFLGTSAAGGYGTTGYPLMNRYFSAAAYGMAGACSAYPIDSSIRFFNPAGLSETLSGIITTFCYPPDVDTDIMMFNFGYSFGLRPFNIKYPIKFGFSGSVMRSGTVDIYNDNGTIINNVIGQNDILFLGTISTSLSDDLACGINCKALQSVIADEYQATVFGIDLGILFKMPDSEKRNYAFSISNIEILQDPYISVKDPLPLTFRFGTSYETVFRRKKSIICCDIVKTAGSPYHFSLGTEIEINRYSVVRAGMKLGYRVSLVSIGAGFEVRRNLKIDAGLSMNTYLIAGQITLQYMFSKKGGE